MSPMRRTWLSDDRTRATLRDIQLRTHVLDARPLPGRAYSIVSSETARFRRSFSAIEILETLRLGRASDRRTRAASDDSFAGGDAEAWTDRANRLTLCGTDLRFPPRPMICSVVYRFRAIPFSPELRFLGIADSLRSTWYRLRGAHHAKK